MIKALKIFHSVKNILDIVIYRLGIYDTKDAKKKRDLRFLECIIIEGNKKECLININLLSQFPILYA